MEKTKQKHPLVKRVLSTLLAASIAVGTFAANAFADGSDDRYDKAYTIGNILSNFQYFTKGDLKGSAIPSAQQPLAALWIKATRSETARSPPRSSTR